MSFKYNRVNAPSAMLFYIFIVNCDCLICVHLDADTYHLGNTNIKCCAIYVLGEMPFKNSLPAQILVRDHIQPILFFALISLRRQIRQTDPWVAEKLADCP